MIMSNESYISGPEEEPEESRSHELSPIRALWAAITHRKAASGGARPHRSWWLPRSVLDPLHEGVSNLPAVLTRNDINDVAVFSQRDVTVDDFDLLATGARAARLHQH